MKQGRKISGGRYKSPKKPRLTGRRKEERKVKLGEVRRKVLRGRGGSLKLVNLSSNLVNLITSKGTKKTNIKNVVETPSNTFLARQNILVKGAIIDTELGRARITNRPSQEGNVQAVLLNK
jgi:small subunit ribosomal protein S8e